MFFAPHPGCQWLKMLPYAGHNLRFRHFVAGFQREYWRVEFIFFNPFPEFALGLAGAKDEDFTRRMQVGNDFVIIAREFALICPLP